MLICGEQSLTYTRLTNNLAAMKLKINIAASAQLDKSLSN